MIVAETHRLSWQDLVREEPGLAELEREVRAIRRPASGYFCANDCWYGYGRWPGIKPRLLFLVGWQARNPKLGTSRAYDIAYEHLYRLLPDCRECGCL